MRVPYYSVCKETDYSSFYFSYYLINTNHLFRTMISVLARSNRIALVFNSTT